MSECKTFGKAALAALTLILCLPPLVFAQLKGEEQIAREVGKEMEKKLKATKLEYGLEQERAQLLKSLQRVAEAKSDVEKVRGHRGIVQASTNFLQRINIIHQKGILPKTADTEEGYNEFVELLGKSLRDSIEQVLFYGKSPEKSARLETINLIVDIHGLAQALQNVLDHLSEKELRRVGLEDSEFMDLGSSLQQACRDELYQMMKADYDRDVSDKALSAFNALPAQAAEVKFLTQTAPTGTAHRGRRVRLSFNFLEPLLTPFKLLFRLL